MSLLSLSIGHPTAQMIAVFALVPSDEIVGSSLSWKIERLLKTHGIDFCLSARNKRLAFDLIEPIVVMKHCDVRVTTARSRDAELTTVEPADSVLDVELDQASFRHLLYSVAHQSVFLDLVSGFGNLRDRQREHASLLRGGIDVCVERTAVRSIISRRLDARIGRKMDREGMVGRLVFLPLSCPDRTSEDDSEEECTQAHVVAPLHVLIRGSLHIWASKTNKSGAAD